MKYEPEWREGCPLHYHDTPSAYGEGCRCPLARERERIYRKRMRTGRPTGRGWVDGRGTRRRIQALYAMGWNAEQIAEHAGTTRTVIKKLGIERGNGQLLRNSVAMVERAYDQLHAKPGPCDQVRQIARRKGYPSPWAWDDIDRDEAPPTVAIVPHHGKRGVDLDEVDFLLSCGESIEQIAHRYGVQVEAIYRHGWARNTGWQRGEVAS